MFIFGPEGISVIRHPFSFFDRDRDIVNKKHMLFSMWKCHKVNLHRSS